MQQNLAQQKVLLAKQRQQYNQVKLKQSRSFKTIQSNQAQATQNEVKETQIKSQNLTKENQKVAIVQLGCAKNIVDGEVFMGDLQQQGFQVTQDTENADKIIVNTCAFIDEAKSESIEAILEAREQLGSKGQVVVTGCLSQRYSDNLKNELPEVDNFVGFEHYKDLGQVLNTNNQLQQSNGKVKVAQSTQTLDQSSKVKVGSVNVPFRNEQSRYRLTPNHMAYLRVAEGCNHKCTFCAIPGFRGKFRSKTFQQLLDEAKHLVSQGVKELCLIAEDTNQYGQDRKDGKNLAKLMRELAKLDGLKWMRILYAYPSYFDDELIQEIAVNDKVCKYIDIPLQHINNMMLFAMNRPAQDHTLKLLNKLRDNIPNLVLRTTFISGFPGETEEYHRELVNFIKKFKFQRLGCFQYSQEDGTPAGQMENQISERVKERRRDQIVSIQQQIQKEYSEQLVGQEVDVLIDSVDEEGNLVGRTEFDAPEVDNLVYITQTDNNISSCNKQLQVGDFVRCKIYNNIEFDLEAYPV